MKYPVRAKIIDVVGIEVFPGYIGRTPDESKPHIGKEGLAEEIGDNVRITLDDGNILMGYECWWTPINETEQAGGSETPKKWRNSPRALDPLEGTKFTNAAQNVKRECIS